MIQTQIVTFLIVVIAILPPALLVRLTMKLWKKRARSRFLDQTAIACMAKLIREDRKHADSAVKAWQAAIELLKLRNTLKEDVKE